MSLYWRAVLMPLTRDQQSVGAKPPRDYKQWADVCKLGRGTNTCDHAGAKSSATYYCSAVHWIIAVSRLLSSNFQFPFSRQWFLRRCGKRLFTDFWWRLLIWLWFSMAHRTQESSGEYWSESRLLISFDCQPWTFVSPLYTIIKTVASCFLL